MQNKMVIVLASTAAVAVAGLVGWQSWNTHQLQQEVAQLQQQLATPAVTAQNAPALALNTPATPPQASPAQQLSPVLPSGPQNATPLNPPAAADPWGDEDPFVEMQRMQQQMHQQMQQLMSGFGRGKGSLFDPNAFQLGQGFGSSMGFGAEPGFEFKENADNYQLTVSIPPGSNVELNTSVHGHDLTVEGKVSSEQQDSGKGSSFRSQQTRQFARTLPLPADADGQGIATQNLKDKVVITLPKLPQAQRQSSSRSGPRALI